MSGNTWSLLIALALCALAYVVATISRRRAAKRQPKDERHDQ